MSRLGATLSDRVDAATAQFGRTDPRTLSLRVRWADGLIAAGMIDKGLIALDAMVADCEADLGPRHETTIVLSNNLLMRQAERLHADAAHQLATLASVAAEMWGPLDHRTMVVRSNLAAANGIAGRFDDAVAQIEEMLETADALDDDLVDTLQTNLASWRQRREE